MPGIITKNSIDQVRHASDIVDVVGAYVELQRAGSSWKARCPFHDERTPSFHVNPARQAFHCFGCGAGGDVFGFVMQREGVDFPTAVRLLAHRVGIELQFEAGRGDGNADDRGIKEDLYRLHELAAAFLVDRLWKGADARVAREYLESRDIPAAAARDWGLGFSPDAWEFLLGWARRQGFPDPVLAASGLFSEREGRGFYDRFRGRLLFPIWDELARVVAFSGRLLDPEAKAAKYVNSPETPLFHKGRILYAMNRARQAITKRRQALICEGQIDVLRCHLGGFDWAVAPQGTALTPDHARILGRFADEALLVFDADAAGIKAAVRSAGLLLAADMGVKAVTLPPGEDPDSLIRGQGPDAFRACLDAAGSIAAFAARHLEEGPGDDIPKIHTILDLINQAPSAVRRDHLLSEAAEALGVRESSLRADLRARSHPARPPVARPEPVEARPALHESERALLHHYVAYPEARPFIEDYIQPFHFRDAKADRLYRQLTRHEPGQDEDMMPALRDDPDMLAFAAAFQVLDPPPLTAGTTPESAAQELVLRLLIRHIDQERARLRELRDQAPPEQRAEFEEQIAHHTEDILHLREGWDRAVEVLQFHAHG